MWVTQPIIIGRSYLFFTLVIRYFHIVTDLLKCQQMSVAVTTTFKLCQLLGPLLDTINCCINITNFKNVWPFPLSSLCFISLTWSPCSEKGYIRVIGHQTDSEFRAVRGPGLGTCWQGRQRESCLPTFILCSLLLFVGCGPLQTNGKSPWLTPKPTCHRFGVI